MANDKDQDGFFPKYQQPSFVLRMWGKLVPAADNKYALTIVCAAQMGVGVLLLAYPRRSTFRAKYGKWPYRAVKATGILTGSALIGCTAIFDLARTRNLTYDPWAQRARADRVKALKEGKKVTWWWGAHDHKPVGMNEYMSELRVLLEIKKMQYNKKKLADVAESGFKPTEPLLSSDLYMDDILWKYVLPRVFPDEVPISPISRKLTEAMFQSLGLTYEELVAANRKFREGVLEQVENPLFLAHRPWLFGSSSSMDAAIKEVLGEGSNDPDILEGLYNDIAEQWDGSIMWGIIAGETDVTIRLIPGTDIVELVEEAEDEE
ncbi:hypothetical protein B0I72DRAFT_137127 [Yarrowia lipolytica]|jgi:hypothetical protein|uniref:YALI0E04466p n=2 Tax=Yarrowia lipolytica TaxID=4952 RepID=Q6C720_YARLI|nr:YALI0E04466p [Yarrowia lipolytica CLIB122]AOW04945.1 hypothetical protein YALI1_E05403g [Yarrowia lipolytica]KAB8286230.1 hypothetical protein BKA91DRAFT_132142 [Yarrowia lipolytica]KAE8171554.1 hypothetical protein BKA90DRAFT_138968 [Yarrowia lipolytica]KAJ8056521.1 hypothetical protein LXG23DRAFT_16740 [Yarrowia lipolytica]QNQ00356.1 Mitochondrial inner membrane i-AAA protease complex subunit MGR1 [Yarrowia lipolytica]|eukprot:XP_503542.1 YALI0E04466p [Yarrowia lipolytica CLIB122]